MKINVNGKEHQVAEGTSVEKLLRDFNITGPVAVELNRKICPKKLHATTLLNPADTLEIVTIVGGG